MTGNPDAPPPVVAFRKSGRRGTSRKPASTIVPDPEDRLRLGYRQEPAALGKARNPAIGVIQTDMKETIEKSQYEHFRLYAFTGTFQ